MKSAIAAPALEARPALIEGRTALVLEGFRIAAGLLAIRHFAGELQRAPRLIGADGLWHPDVVSSTSVLADIAHRVRGLPTPALQVWFGFGVALAGMVTLGLWPRWCAGLLFVIAAITHQAMPPMHLPDDSFIRAVALTLAALPVGGALAVPHPGRPRARGTTGFAFGLIGLLVLGGYVEMALSAEFLGWTRIGLFAVSLAAASLIAPGRMWRVLGLLPASFCAWHLSAASGGYVAAGVLVAGHAALAFAPDWYALPKGARIDALAAAVAAALALQSIHGVAREVRPAGLAAIARASAAVLTQIGLSPGAFRAPGGAPTPKLDIVSDDGGAGLPAPAGIVDLDDPRAQMLIHALAAPAAPVDIRSTVARGIVARHCRGDRSARSPGELRITSGAHRASVAWFDCGAEASRPKVILLDGAGSARGRDHKTRPAEVPVEQQGM